VQDAIGNESCNEGTVAISSERRPEATLPRNPSRNSGRDVSVQDSNRDAIPEKGSDTDEEPVVPAEQNKLKDWNADEGVHRPAAVALRLERQLSHTGV